MANKTLTATYGSSYLDNSNVRRTPSLTNTVAYAAEIEGTIDVPDATEDGTDYDIPFGSVAKASHLQVRNGTGQELALALNGGDPINLPDGATFAMSMAAPPAANPVTEATVTTTATQSGAGTVSFWVCGDPV